MALGVALGMSSGMPSALIRSWMSRQVVWEAPVLALGPPLLAALAVGAITQKRKPVFWTTLLFTTAHLLTYLIVRLLMDASDGGASILTWPFLVVAIVLALCGAAVGALALGFRWGARKGGFVILEQDGSLCWHCGYELGSPALDRCPECGTVADPARYRWRPVWPRLQWAAQQSRCLAFAVAALLTVGGLCLFIQRGAWGTLRFAYTFAHGGLLTPGTYFDLSNPRHSWRSQGSAVWQPFPGTTDRGILINYFPKDLGGTPGMQLWVAVLTGSGDNSAYMYSKPWIVCELNRPQAQWALRHGLPDSLVSELEEAERAQTSNAAAGPGPGDVVRRIPAGRHFPEDLGP